MDFDILSLQPPQLQALFDILTHHETYAEIQDLKYYEAVVRFGPPFTDTTGDGLAHYPILQAMAGKILDRDMMSESLWSNITAIIQRLAAANLSDSYEKGCMGLRKSAAAAYSAMLESFVRGMLAGVAKADRDIPADRQYDYSKASDLEQAWQDAVQGILYGDLLDQVFDVVTASPDVDDLPAATRGALELVIVQVATTLHHFHVVMPDGQTLLKMIDLMHTLTPHSILKQTARMGNVPAMLKATTKILLAKVHGKNLLQTIVSKSIGWDISAFEKTAHKIEKAINGPGNEVLAIIQDFVARPRSKSDPVRLRSQKKGISIIAAILDAYETKSVYLTLEQHDMAQEYYAALLSIRDRREIINALTKQEPDLMSELVREGMRALEPILQRLQDSKFDMGQAIKLQKSFTSDLLKTAKIKRGHTPSIEDFVGLVRRQLPLLWRMWHDVAKKCPAISNGLKEWERRCIHQFRATNGSIINSSTIGPLERPLLAMFDKLPPHDQQRVRAALDAHALYLIRSHHTSLKQLQQILDGRSKTSLGSGLNIPRWQSLLDCTLITPADMTGPFRYGKEVKLRRLINPKKAKEKTEETTDIDVDFETAKVVMNSLPAAPDVSVVVDSLAEPFRAYLMSERVKSLKAST